MKTGCGIFRFHPRHRRQSRSRALFLSIAFIAGSAAKQQVRKANDLMTLDRRMTIRIAVWLNGGGLEIHSCFSGNLGANSVFRGAARICRTWD
jgi:hypothetical protein